jgi:hypothetical protein
MSADRELLAAAAKAAGLHVVGNWDFLGHFSGLRVREDDAPGGYRWNPLTVDQDAFQLAVQLKIPLQFPDWQDIARTWGREGDDTDFVEPAIQHNGDLAKATRRAIVRAAAAMGEAS